MSRFRLSPFARKLLAKIHLWLAIGFGTHFALLGLTGACVVFADEIDSVLNPHLFQSRPTGPMKGTAEILNVVRASFPNLAIDRIYVPKSDNGSYRLRIGPKESRLEVFVDPYSGKVLGDRPYEDSVLRTILRIHTSLLLPGFGRSLNGITAIAASLMLISGLWMWWPATWSQVKARLRIQPKASAKRRNHDLHNVFGFYPSIVLLAIVLTGTILAFEDGFKSIFARVGGVPEWHDPAKAPPTRQPSLSEDAILGISEREAPGTSVVKLLLPTKNNRLAEVHRELPEGKRLGRRVEYWIDSETGQVAGIDDSRKNSSAERLYELARPVHTGAWGGVVSRALYVCVGLAPLALLITGLLKLRHRLVDRKKLAIRRQEQKGTPAEAIPKRELVETR